MSTRRDVRRNNVVGMDETWRLRSDRIELSARNIRMSMGSGDS